MSTKRFSSIVACCLVLAWVNLAPAQATVPSEANLADQAAPAAARELSYGRLPLLFIENRGQTDPKVNFTLQAGAATVYFTQTGVTYALVEPPSADDRPILDHGTPGGRDAAPASHEPRRRWAVKLDFVGANLDVRPVGQEPRRRSSPTSGESRKSGTPGSARSGASSTPTCGRALTWLTTARAVP